MAMRHERHIAERERERERERESSDAIRTERKTQWSPGSHRVGAARGRGSRAQRERALQNTDGDRKRERERATEAAYEELGHR